MLSLLKILGPESSYIESVDDCSLSEPLEQLYSPIRILMKSIVDLIFL